MNALIIERVFDCYISVKGVIVNNCLFDFGNKEAIISKNTVEKLGFSFFSITPSLIVEIKPKNISREFKLVVDGSYDVFDKGTDFLNVFLLEQRKTYLIKVVKE